MTLSKKIIIISLLFIAFSYLLCDYLNLFSYIEGWGRRRRRRRRRRAPPPPPPKPKPYNIKDDELQKKSGTSEEKELEKLKKNYKGDTEGAKYEKLPDYEKEPKNIIKPIDSMNEFNNKRKNYKDKSFAIEDQWTQIDNKFNKA